MGQIYDWLFGPRVSNEEETWKNADGERVVSSQSTPETMNTNNDEAEPEKDSDPYRDDAGNKVRPELAIERVKANPSNDMKQLELWVVIKNRSEFEVEVDRVNVMGQRAEIGRTLGPNGSCEVRIYNGKTPTSDAYHVAEVQFKITGSGDYFQADHSIQYNYENNEKGEFYIPSNFDLNRPIKDI